MRLPDDSEVGVQLLGDYGFERPTPEQLVLRQKVAEGRFLVAMTRDLTAHVRVLNGWSVEFRTAGQVHQLLHSNRAGKQRPIGPIHTDARYALASWTPSPDFAPPMMLDLQLQVIQATQIHASLLEPQPETAPDWVI
jgi:hypothetical protein